MKKIVNKWRSLIVVAGVAAIVIGGIVWHFYRSNEGIVFIDDMSAGNWDADDSLSAEEMDLHNSGEYRSWLNTTDTSFTSLFNGNRTTDILAMRPRLVILWAGSAFAKSYNAPRGHMYAIDDLHKSLRTGAPKGPNDGPQPASCWRCKSQDASRLIGEIGKEAFYKRKWAAWGSEIVNPVSCADCHKSENMELHISRSYLTDACERMGMKMDNVSEQEMRSLVCAQCHSEYYFRKENKEVVLPWDKGLTMEAIEKYYDEIEFTDYTHQLSRAPLLKAQHPDYELSRMGIHAQRGVSCGECHMPYIGANENGYNNHHIQSPLGMIGHTCQACHRDSEETLRQDVYSRQLKAKEMRDRLETELTKAHIEAKFAWDRGATEEQMKDILKLIRQAQWRWDFGITSHGAAFHAPQEVQRILGSGIDKAWQARMAITRVLVKLGYTGEVPMPDISTKEKAQEYIGLDPATDKAAKEEFLKTVLPRWKEEARANNRLLEQAK